MKLTTSVAVVQARTSSSRLPGKVLLPLSGLPMSVLAALRAGNTGRAVILATSCEQSDDALAEVAIQHGLRCYRGSLSSPLERIVGSLSDYPGDTIVFRLTADNVFPDGELLDELQREFIERQMSYLCCNGVASGLPYGLSAEVFWLRDLRWALSVAEQEADHEHVTPLLRRRFGERYFDRYVSLGWGMGRCTVDCFDDYLMVQRAFFGIADPIKVGWKKLCQNLLADSECPRFERPVTKLVLGTVQLGLPYGINNSSGKPSLDEGRKIIRSAIRHGVAYIDTARAYGCSEQVVCAALSSGWAGRATVITKLSSLPELDQAVESPAIEPAVRASVFESCQKLGMARLDVLMVHRAAHIYAWHGRVWAELLRLVDEGVIGQLGASVQCPEELEQVLNNRAVDYVQLPMNLLDWRWDALTPRIEQAKAERGLIVHVRSALLQGLLVSEEPSLWRRAHVVESEGLVEWMNGCVQAFRRESLVDLCFAYARGVSWVDGVCVGMETYQQFSENARLFQNKPLQASDIRQVCKTRPVVEALTLDPAAWHRGDQ
ncbi:aldo/keto reductase [Stutzerimonas nitrititolerans]|uniref:aldo/keto reductase n=1 Tax=Stutzerimonas nitrititolerans TaxID=2482751 RepID=UPI0028A248E9|nr:aldo/keto reductase [Stutzerimonas nitrititolerans]